MSARYPRMAIFLKVGSAASRLQQWTKFDKIFSRDFSKIQYSGWWNFFASNPKWRLKTSSQTANEGFFSSFLNRQLIFMWKLVSGFSGENSYFCSETFLELPMKTELSWHFLLCVNQSHWKFKQRSWNAKSSDFSKLRIGDCFLMLLRELWKSIQ